jgi:hypothetical protein
MSYVVAGALDALIVVPIAAYLAWKGCYRYHDFSLMALIGVLVMNQLLLMFLSPYENKLFYDFNIFGSNGNRKIKKAQRGSRKKANNRQQSSTNTAPKTGVNHDLNLRLDFSLRKQAAITRDIATMTSAANSGNTALKISFMADYTLSRLLTLSAYYDRQTNTPLLSASSYPTTTHDFGISMKFSLTR